MRQTNDNVISENKALKQRIQGMIEENDALSKRVTDSGNKDMEQSNTFLS